MLCDGLVVGQVIPFNPASVVHGPSYSARTGKTRILDREETRTLFDSIDPATLVGARAPMIGAMIESTCMKLSAADEVAQWRPEIAQRGHRIVPRLIGA